MASPRHHLRSAPSLLVVPLTPHHSSVTSASLSQFVDKGTEARRGQPPCPRPHSGKCMACLAAGQPPSTGGGAPQPEPGAAAEGLQKPGTAVPGGEAREGPPPVERHRAGECPDHTGWVSWQPRASGAAWIWGQMVPRVVTLPEAWRGGRSLPRALIPACGFGSPVQMGLAWGWAQGQGPRRADGGTRVGTQPASSLVAVLDPGGGWEGRAPCPVGTVLEVGWGMACRGHRGATIVLQVQVHSGLIQGHLGPDWDLPHFTGGGRRGLGEPGTPEERPEPGSHSSRWWHLEGGPRPPSQEE